MNELVLKKKSEKDNLTDCVVYLMQHCRCFEKSESERKFCLDVAKKALFLYNLSPKSFGRSKKERQSWLDSINELIEKYTNSDEYHTKYSLSSE